MCVGNVPPPAQEDDIFQMLRNIQVEPKKITILRDAAGRNKGEAYVEMSCTEDCMKASNLHGSLRCMGDVVRILPLTADDMKHDIANHEMKVRSRMGGAPPDNMMDSKYHSSGAMVGPPPPDRYPGRPYSPPPRDYGRPGYPDLPPRPRSPPYDRRRPYDGPMGGHAPIFFVKMANLHFKVTREDILEFFAQYDPISDSVRLVYNKFGNPTGDGVLSFMNPDAARDAIDKLDGKVLLGRNIHLEMQK